MKSPRLLVAFDTSDFLTTAITDHLDAEITVTFASGVNDLLHLAGSANPMAILFDFASFVSEAPRIVARLSRAAPTAALCVVTRTMDGPTFGALLANGVRCLRTGERLSVAGFLATIQTVLADPRAVVIDRPLLDLALGHGAVVDLARLPVEPFDVDGLDRRILLELIRGSTQEAAAMKLGLSRSGIQRHTRSLVRRFHARSSQEAAIFADRMGVLKDLELPPGGARQRRRAP